MKHACVHAGVVSDAVIRAGVIDDAGAPAHTCAGSPAGGSGAHAGCSCWILMPWSMLMLIWIILRILVLVLVPILFLDPRVGT